MSSNPTLKMIIKKIKKKKKEKKKKESKNQNLGTNRQHG